MCGVELGTVNDTVQTLLARCHVRSILRVLPVSGVVTLKRECNLPSKKRLVREHGTYYSLLALGKKILLHDR
jgi:hypothetical protein